MTSTPTLRDAPLTDLVTLLRDESLRREDVVLPASELTMLDSGAVRFGHILPAQITEAGVTPEQLRLTMLSVSDVAAGHLSDKLAIPAKYWDRMRDHAPALLAHNVNTWLHHDTLAETSWYVRALTAGPGDAGVGILRAVLSDRFRPMDDIDVLTAALAGIAAAGVDPASLHITADRSDKRMYVRITAPTVVAEAHDLVERYTDPATGRAGRDFGVVQAGLILRNSDVGHGAFTITPRIVFLVCRNGMTRPANSQRQVHLGGQRDDGVVDWSDETMRRELALIESRTTDAVRTFLEPSYLQGVIDELRGFSARRLDDPAKVIANVTRQLRFSDAEQALILNAFISGGDTSPLGVAQALTWAAHGADITADRAADFEDSAWRAMTLAAAM